MSLLLLLRSSAPVPASDVVATLFRRPDMVNPVALLDDSRDRQWQDVLSEPGGASIKLQNDDPDLVFIEDNDLIRFDLLGVPAFTMICEKYDRVSIAQGEEAEEVTTWAGRGHLALFEQGLVYPSRGVSQFPIEQSRVFNWTSTVYDDSFWTPAGQYTLSAPAGFPDLTAFAMWQPGFTAGLNMPLGTVYFRKTITFPATDYYTFFLAIDNLGDLYLDGQKLSNVQDPLSFNRASTITMLISAGPHVIAIRGENTTNYVLTVENPGQVIFAVYRSDQTGDLLTTLIAHSDNSWSILAYPASPPGMTPGKVIRVCLEEVQARGGLTDITLNFSDTLDSGGVPWPEVVDIATQVGTDVLSLIRQMTSTHIDAWMEPSTLILNAWNKGGRGTAQPVVLEAPTNPNDPTTGNITELVHLGES